MARQKGNGLSGCAGVVNSPLLNVQYVNFNINIDFGVSDNDRIKKN